MAGTFYTSFFSMPRVLAALTALAATLLPQVVFADQPWSTSVDGRLFKANTSTPLRDPSLVFVIQILNPSRNCVLYEESQIFDTQATNGFFNLKVGSRAPDLTGKRTANDPGYSMSKIFNNTLNSFAMLPTCLAGYTPSDGDARYLRLIVQPSSGGSEQLSPDISLTSVPSAKVAETVGGLSRSELLQVDMNGSSRVDMANLQAVFNTTQLPILNSLLAGTSGLYVTAGSNGTISVPGLSGNAFGASAGQIWYDTSTHQLKFQNNSGPQTLGIAGSGISSLTAGTGLNVGAGPGGTLTSAGTLHVNVGTSDGQIVQVQTGGKLPALNGVDLTHLNGSAVQSGTIGGSTSINTTGTFEGASLSVSGNAVANEGRFNALRIYKPSTTNYVEFVTDSALSSPVVLTLPPALGANGQVLQTDNTGKLSWVSISDAPGGSAGGDLGGNYPSPSVVGIRGNMVAPGALTIGDAGKIYRWSGTQFEAANFGVDDLRTEAGLQQFAANCNSSQTLTWSAITDGFGCTPIGISATQITAGTVDASHLPVVGVDKGGTGQTTANGALNALLPPQSLNSGKVLRTNGTDTSWVDMNAGTVTNVTAAAPLSVTTGTTTPAISISQATSSTSGYLSSSDWTAFNAKANVASLSNYVLKTGDSMSGALTMAHAIRLKAGAPGSDTASMGLAFEDNGDTGLFMTNYTNSNTGDLNFYVNASPRMTLLSSGKTGIGTVSPTNLLHLSSSSANTGLTVSGSNTAGNTVSVQLFANMGAGSYNQLTQAGDMGLIFSGTAVGTAKGFVIAPWASAPNTGLRIDGSGLVGIGVSSPTEMLDVSGKVKASQLCIGSDCRSSWPTASAGTVSSVSSANADIAVATTTTTPVLQLNSGTGANQILKLNASSEIPAVSGANLTDLNASNLASGTLPTARLPAFSGDVTSSPGTSTLTLGTVPISKGGTGSTSFAANKLLSTNGTGTSLTSWSCSTGQVIKFDGTGVLGCDTIAGVLGYSPANGTNYVAKAGDTMSGALNLPINGLVAGTNQLVLSGGNVGIGTTSPSAQLHLSTSTSGAWQYIQTSAAGFDANLQLQSLNGGWVFKARESDSQKLYISPAAGLGGVAATPTLTLLQTGGVGVGTTSPGTYGGIPTKLEIATTGNHAFGSIKSDPGFVQSLLFVSGSTPLWSVHSRGTFDAPNNRFSIMDATSEVLTILPGGNVGVRNTNPSFSLDVAGTAGARISSNSTWGSLELRNASDAAGNGTAGYRMIEMYQGNIWRGEVYVDATGAHYGNASDYRLKENLQPVSNALDRVLNLPVYSFNYKTSPHATTEGFLAHEAKLIAPYAVSGDKDAIDQSGAPLYQVVDYGALTPLLTAAIQAIHEKYASLRADWGADHDRLNQQSSRIERLELQNKRLKEALCQIHSEAKICGEP